MHPTVLGPGAGERLSAGGSSQIVIKAGSEQTAGSLFLSETTVEPGFPGPPPHRHSVLHDMFYVLEGTLSVQVGDEITPLGPGSFACVPPGVVHTFSNPSELPVRFLNFSTPGGFEIYMRELGAAAAAGPLSRETMGTIASRHDVQLA
jgi:mannose-6-phosphate isomerase-like protein (cupin superfamily)